MIISGIVSLVSYNIFGKRILLLGEKHTTEGWCDPVDEDGMLTINVNDYILNLVSETPDEECIDVFLEGTYKEKSSIKFTRSGLFITRDELDFIFGSSENENIRIHHIDTRVIPENFWFDFLKISQRKEYTFGYAEKLYFYNKNFRDSISESDIIGAIDYLLTINRKKNRQYFLKIAELMKKFLRIPPMVSDFDSWEENYFKIIEKGFRKLNRSIMSRTKLITTLRIVYHHLIENKLDYSMGILSMIPMDLYTLIRMFTEFNDKPSRVCNSNRTIKNIIIHSGSAHTEVYDFFLNTCFKINPEARFENTHKSVMCVFVKNFDFWK